MVTKLPRPFALRTDDDAGAGGSEGSRGVATAARGGMARRRRRPGDGTDAPAPAPSPAPPPARCGGRAHLPRVAAALSARAQQQQRRRRTGAACAAARASGLQGGVLAPRTHPPLHPRRRPSPTHTGRTVPCGDSRRYDCWSAPTRDPPAPSMLRSGFGRVPTPATPHAPIPLSFHRARPLAVPFRVGFSPRLPYSLRPRPTPPPPCPAAAVFLAVFVLPPCCLRTQVGGAASP